MQLSQARAVKLPHSFPRRAVEFQQVWTESVEIALCLSGS